MCSIVEELYFEEALCVVLVCRTFAEVISVVVHQFISAILFADDVFQNRKCFAVFLTHHEGAGIIAGRSTAGGTSAAPFTAFIAGGKQSHCFLKVFLHLVEHRIVGAVGTIKSVQRRVGGIIRNERRILIIAH